MNPYVRRLPAFFNQLAGAGTFGQDRIAVSLHHTHGLSARKVVYAVCSVAVVAILAFAVVSFHPSNQQTSNSGPFQVLRTDITVSYNAECLVLEPTGHTCPTISIGANGTSESPMRNVELISYQGTHYYAGNFSAGFVGPSVSHNIWFTNSSIFCTSPSLGNYNACPLNEALPQASW